MNRRSLARLAAGGIASAAFAASTLVLSCGSSHAGPDAGTALDASISVTTADASSEKAIVDASIEDPADAADTADADDAEAGSGPPGKTEGCPEGMVLVEGEYCPAVEQTCLEHHPEYVRDEAKKKKKAKKTPALADEKAHEKEGEGSTVSERCLRYEAPTKCLSKKTVPMRFCVDRYEWPNQKGELPALLVSWTDAKKLCESKGKRLCGEAEYDLACEGPEMLPYTYGYVRDASKCNIDRPYKKREHKLAKYARCMKSESCKKELAKLDQRLPTGSMPECVSPFGAYDMNGNINEWVERPKQKYPNRSGLKGGWWGPVRGRCRPTVGFHKEDDYGYEEGFRCCANAETKAP